jgi:hypothetical protein
MDVPLKINGVSPPKPEGNQECDFCNPHKFFKNWDLLAAHITIMHNDNGRKRSFYNGNAPEEILNHPDWTGYEEESS